MENTQRIDNRDFPSGCSMLHGERSNPSESSCVSMKSDQSMGKPIKFKGRQTSTDLRGRSNPPEASCVSMKSNQSMGKPIKFKEKQTSTDLRERSNPPEASCLSMKSDQSMGKPIQFEGRHTSTDKSLLHRERSNPPEASCVSMKSDQSMGKPIKFKGRQASTDLRLLYRDRSNPPESSCDSMKSNLSMDKPVKCKGRHTSTNLSMLHGERSNPSESSCVSMKSDQSMGKPIKFKGRQTSTDLRGRSNPPEASCVSMKSNQSMGKPIKFKEKQTSTDLRERSNPPEASCLSMKSDQSMGKPIKFEGRHTSTDKSLLHRERSNPPEASCVSMKSDQSMGKPIKFKGRQASTDLRLLYRDRSNPPESSCDSMKSNLSMDKPVKCKGRHTSTNLSTFKSNLMKKFQCLHEGTEKQGNPTFLNEIYTELYITESKSGEINKQHEVRQIETQSRRAETEDTPIKCNDIFRPLPEQEKPIRIVLTKGVAGIGKTVSVQKFIVDWSEGKANQDIQLIFPLPFRELNLMKDTKLSLLDLLQYFFPETNEMKISSDANKVFFIFDGLDECRLSLDFQSNVRLCDLSKSETVDVLLTNLIVGNLLPSALIWITSRPAAADLIPSEFVHRVTEVRGFSDPKKEEYFRKRISDQSLANKIISHLKSSRSLHIMCHIPVFCWISSTVLQGMLVESWKGEIPKTVTQMYTHFLILQTNIKHEKDYEKKVKDEDMILKLGKLAFQQLVKGNLIFYDEDLNECGIDVTEASVYSGLCTQIFKEEFGLYQGKVFCFVHLSIQEHLAALYVHLSFTDYINVFDQATEQNVFSKVLNWMKNNSLSGLHQTAVDEALQSKNGHLDLFLRFLLGLSLESNQTLLQELITQTGSCSYDKKETAEYIKQKIRENPSPERCINLFHCLNELGDDSLMQEIQDYLRTGKINQIKLSSQWSALVFVLLTSEQKMEKFDLKKFMGAQNTADEVVQKLLPVIKESRSAQLCKCGITDKGCAVLATALSSNPSHLRDLNLSGNKIQDAGVKLISDGLMDPHCNLESLQLSDCGVTDEGCAALASALRSNPSHLRYLDLTGNKLKDLGINLISSVLDDPHIKMKTLRLSDCGVTDKGCAVLASALRSHPSQLRELNLSRNKLGPSGVKLLCNGLEDPQCNLEILWLINCGITYKVCAALASALRSNLSHLRHLNLSENKLQDKGVDLLCDGLRDPHCKLETLWLMDCSVTDKGCAVLASALRSNPSHLQKLDLTRNFLGKSQMKLLSALKDDTDYELKTLLF